MASAISLYKGAFGRAFLLDIDRSLVTHAHHHCHVLIKAHGPDVSFIIRDRLCTLTDHSVLLLNAWEPHTYLHQANAAPDVAAKTTLLALHVEPCWLATATPIFSQVGHPSFFPEPLLPMDSEFREFADSVISQFWWPQRYDGNVALEAMLFELLNRIMEPTARTWQSRVKSAALRQYAADRRIRKALEIINNNSFTVCEIDDLARECSLSRAHFFSLFKEQTNVTPMVYLNCLKMEMAFDKLSEKGAVIGDIAYDLGFSAQSHFTRFFSQHQGITPTEFRSKVQDINVL